METEREGGGRAGKRKERKMIKRNGMKNIKSTLRRYLKIKIVAMFVPFETVSARIFYAVRAYIGEKGQGQEKKERRIKIQQIELYLE